MGQIFILLLEAIEVEAEVSVLQSILKIFKTTSKAKVKSMLKLGIKNPKTLLKGLKNNQMSQLLDLLKKNNFNEKKQFEIINNFKGQIGLSSSFLQYGIFIKKGNFSGELFLSMNGKLYDFGLVPTSIWLAMVQAKGMNGTGAGSVLWDTIWKNRRTLSTSTGGVRGSREQAIKARRRVFAQIARNQKYLKRQVRQRQAPIATIARKMSVQRKPKLPKGFKW